MGSITKTFVAVCVLRLRDAGRLDLADRFGVHVPGSALDEVTVEQLLTHAGGVQAETDGPWWERTPGGDWTALASAPVGRRFRAGRRFHYSNVGYAALGRLLEVHHGTGWFDVVRDELLRPLGMTRTTTRPSGAAAPGLAVHPFADVLLPEPEHDAGAMAPAGQLWTTATDLARWATFLGGATDGLLAAETLAEMVEPHHVNDEPGKPWTGAHGLGWQVWNVDGARFAGHGGSMPGFLAALRVRLDAGVPEGGSTHLSGRRHGIRSSAGSGRRRRRPPHEHDGIHRDAVAGRRPARRPGPARAGPGGAVVRVRGRRRSSSSSARGTGGRRPRSRGSSTSTWCSASPAPVGVHGSVGSATTCGRASTATTRVSRCGSCAAADGSVSHLDLASFRFTRTPYDPEADVPGGVDESGWR